MMNVRHKTYLHSINKWLLALTLINFSHFVHAVKFPSPEIIKINERLYVFLGPIQHANKTNQGYMINSTVIIGNKGVILVDPGGTDEVGQYVKQLVKNITPKPITHVINTHPHGDHYLGNIAFPKATIVSSKKCRELVVQTGDVWLGMMENMVGRRFPNTKPVTASVVYPVQSKTPIAINGVELVIWVPAGSHTLGDLMVYLPGEKVLIAGDILVNGVVPTMQDGIVKNWIKVLKEIQQLDAKIFIPGHGALMNRNQVKSLHDSMDRFYAGVREGFLAEKSETEIRKGLDLSDWEKLERAYVIGRNINRAYLEIEQDLF